MAYKYAFEGYNEEVMARAYRVNLPISLKKSVELAKFLKGIDVKKAIDILDEIIDKKRVVPYTRYIQEMPHKKGEGIATGGYPVKAAIHFKKLLILAFKSAKEKELGEDLYIKSISARKGTSMWKMGRYLGRKAKRTNLEIVLEVKSKK